MSDDLTRQNFPALREEEIAALRRLLNHDEALLALIRVHAAIVLLGHIAKWLSAILGALVLLKGFF